MLSGPIFRMRVFARTAVITLTNHKNYWIIHGGEVKSEKMEEEKGRQKSDGDRWSQNRGSSAADINDGRTWNREASDFVFAISGYLCCCECAAHDVDISIRPSSLHRHDSLLLFLLKFPGTIDASWMATLRARFGDVATSMAFGTFPFDWPLAFG